MTPALGLVQEGRAQATLDALKSRLALLAIVRRDGQWKTQAATELVPGDIVKLTLGSIVPADVRLIDGEVLLDQAMLTGESLPVEGRAGTQTYAGALTRRGEAYAEVIATGARTRFGKTAQLVQVVHGASILNNTRGAPESAKRTDSECANAGDEVAAGVNEHEDLLAPIYRHRALRWRAADSAISPNPVILTGLRSGNSATKASLPPIFAT